MPVDGARSAAVILRAARAPVFGSVLRPIPVPARPDAARGRPFARNVGEIDSA